MKYRSTIVIDGRRINYELNNFGAAVVVVPSGIAQDEIDDAIKVLNSKYNDVSFDIDGDIVISG